MSGSTSWCHNFAPSVHFVHAHNYNEHYSASLFQRLKLHKYKTVFDVRWDMHNLKSWQNIAEKRYFTLLLHKVAKTKRHSRCLLVCWLIWKGKKWMRKFMQYKKENIINFKKYSKNSGMPVLCSEISQKVLLHFKGKREKSVPASTSRYTWKYHCIYRMTKADILCFKYNRKHERGL